MLFSRGILEHESLGRGTDCTQSLLKLTPNECSLLAHVYEHGLTLKPLLPTTESFLRTSTKKDTTLSFKT